MNAASGKDAPPHPYTRLMAPLLLGTMTLRNRIVMGAMHTRLDLLDRSTQRISAFYRARAEGEVALIITGGVSPNHEGRIEDEAPLLNAESDMSWHQAIVNSVRGTDTKICMQILHSGRYGKFEGCVAPSPIKSRINRYTPKALSTQEVWKTIDDFAQTAVLARDLGYHAIEIMGSEGYLISQFTTQITNQRNDEFGGNLEGRLRFPLEVMKAVREKVGSDFPVIYRISAVDLIEGGMLGHEVAYLANLLQQSGADALNTGFGWHESKVPTIAHVVPRAAWGYATKHVKDAVSIPVIISNRINNPELAEALLESGTGDLISMARPMLADPLFAKKARLDQANSINTCIACNQACLDPIFLKGTASCLVNPRAGHEIEFDESTPERSKRIAVIGAGAAGISFAINAAKRGHRITLIETNHQLGGQLQMARAIPDKTEFDQMLRYLSNELKDQKVEIQLGHTSTAAELMSSGFDEIVIATGVRPRQLDIAGIHHPKVLSYVDVLLHRKNVGAKVAIIGAGGIGFDVAEFLLGNHPHVPPNFADYSKEFGLDLSMQMPGGLRTAPITLSPRKHVVLLQRKMKPIGSELAISTGWILRDKLKRLDVEMINGVHYERIDDDGLHIRAEGVQRCIEADTVVICAGQTSELGLYHELIKAKTHLPLHLIGGAREALELDAMRAIDQATRLAMTV